jgi:hypothetical protein
VFCRASCAAKCPVLLASAGLLRQYIPVLLRKRGDPSPRPFGHFPAPAAMLGTANGAGFCRNPSVPGLHRGVVRVSALLREERNKRSEIRLLRQDAAQRGPLWRGEWREERPEGAAPPGCAFFGLPFFAQAKKGDSLACRASESSALEKIKRTRTVFQPFAGMTSKKSKRSATCQIVPRFFPTHGR